MVFGALLWVALCATDEYYIKLSNRHFLEEKGDDEFFLSADDDTDPVDELPNKNELYENSLWNIVCLLASGLLFVYIYKYNTSMPFKSLFEGTLSFAFY